jgi:hypothetical protein
MASLRSKWSSNSGLRLLVQGQYQLADVYVNTNLQMFTVSSVLVYICVDANVSKDHTLNSLKVSP